MVMNWAIIGTGNIANVFMSALQHVKDARVVGVYGRTLKNLDSFADRWGIESRYSDLTEMLQRKEIEAVYIASAHVVHHEHVALALSNGKHVLCEKPMAMSYAETRDLIDIARKKNVYLMEAMWTRFFPLVCWLRDFTAEASFGKPLNVNADFSFEYPYDANYRFFRRDLGGGCMRSAGIYPLAFACMVFGSMPTRVCAVAEMRNDVDLRTGAVLQFPGERQQSAQIYTGFQGQSCCMANIAFEKGSVVIPDFIHPDTAYVMPWRGETKKIVLPYEQPGLQYEVLHSMECIRKGMTQSSIMPLEESAQLARITDQIYEQIRR